MLKLIVLEFPLKFLLEFLLESLLMEFSLKILEFLLESLLMEFPLKILEFLGFDRASMGFCWSDGSLLKILKFLIELLGATARSCLHGGVPRCLPSELKLLCLKLRRLLLARRTGLKSRPLRQRRLTPNRHQGKRESSIHIE